MVRSFITVAALCLSMNCVRAQEPEAKPLPDPQALLNLAKAHANTWQELQKSYICKETQTSDEFDSHGRKTGTHTDEWRVFFVERTEIHQHIARDGKPLSPDDEKKEQDRVDKEIAKAKAHVEEKQQTPAPRLATLLKVATLSNERREMINGRPTILFDYTGNPDAKTANLTEEVIKHLSGHIWIDEADAANARVDGELRDNFHIAGGLFVNVRKGGKFTMEYTRVNGEIWFLNKADFHADGRILLFKGFDGNEHVTFSDYRKLKTTVTLMPDVQVVGADGQINPDALETPEPAQ